MYLGQFWRVLVKPKVVQHCLNKTSQWPEWTVLGLGVHLSSLQEKELWDWIVYRTHEGNESSWDTMNAVQIVQAIQTDKVLDQTIWPAAHSRFEHKGKIILVVNGVVKCQYLIDASASLRVHCIISTRKDRALLPRHSYHCDWGGQCTNHKT